MLEGDGLLEDFPEGLVPHAVGACNLHVQKLCVTVCACGVTARHGALRPEARPVCCRPHAQKLDRKLVGTSLAVSVVLAGSVADHILPGRGHVVHPLRGRNDLEPSASCESVQPLPEWVVG